MSSNARARILARRAHFVSVALSVAGCAPKPQPTAIPPARTVPSVVETDSKVASDLPPDLPSLEVPDDVPQEWKKRYAWLAETVRTLHARLHWVEKAAPNCMITDDACAKTYRSIADELGHARFAYDDLEPKCAPTTADAKLYVARVDEHRKYAEARFEKVVARLDAVVGAQGATAQQLWSDIYEERVNAYPQPCLELKCDGW